MIIDLTDTTASAVNGALVDARRRSGSPAMGMVLTLVVVTEEGTHYDALRAATEAGREHPSRVLIVVRRPGRQPPRLDAEVRVGGESGPGEIVLLRMHGGLAEHAESVVLPLLLPDAPVVTWWPGACPAVPAEDPLGALAQRRVTDSSGAPDPAAELRTRRDGYRPGDTDFAWTRLTPWRTMLASALDEPYAPVRGADVEAEDASPSAQLLAAWLRLRLGVPVELRGSAGPGITGSALHTTEGPIGLSRTDGRVAVLSRPGQPERTVALPRRTIAELLAEELRRLDPDEVYGATLAGLDTGAPASAPADTGVDTAAPDTGAPADTGAPTDTGAPA